MANAYATIASGGMRNRPIAIEKVVFPGADGKVDKLGKPRRTRAFQDGVTAKATQILKQNVTSGTGTKAQIGCPAAGKTGTTDNHTDAWFVGYTPNLSTAVWVGFPKERVEMYPPVTPISVAGGTYPSEIWGRYMKGVKRGCKDFRSPKTGFNAAPFFGKYATSGAPAGGGTGQPGQQGYGNNGGTYTPGRPAPQGGAAGANGGGGGGGGGGYDPDLYETPPQPAPQTESPGGEAVADPGTGAAIAGE
jgi:penicillin-binding protein 1A